MNTQGEFELFISGKSIAKVDRELVIPIKHYHSELWEYYMKRGNRFYFRCGNKRLMTDIENIIEDVRQLKYGTLLDIEYGITPKSQLK